MTDRMSDFVTMYRDYLERYIFDGGAEDILLEAYHAVVNFLDESTAQAANILDIHDLALKDALGVRRDNDKVQWIYIRRATEFLAQILIITDSFLLALRDNVERDHLTGLYNRLALERIFRRLVTRKGMFLALAMLDIDNFKDINDRYGHLAGDDVLRRLGVILAGSLRGDDVVVRFGGEEFVLLFPDTDYERVGIPLNRILSEIAVEEFPGVGSITVSIGVAELAEDKPSNLDELLYFADKALYRAKVEGKGRVVYYRDIRK